MNIVQNVWENMIQTMKYWLKKCTGIFKQDDI